MFSLVQSIALHFLNKLKLCQRAFKYHRSYHYLVITVIAYHIFYNIVRPTINAFIESLKPLKQAFILKLSAWKGFGGDDSGGRD